MPSQPCPDHLELRYVIIWDKILALGEIDSSSLDRNAKKVYSLSMRTITQQPAELRPTTLSATQPTVRGPGKTMLPHDLPLPMISSGYDRNASIGFDNLSHTDRRTTTSHYFQPSHAHSSTRSHVPPTRTRLSLVPPPAVQSSTAYETPKRKSDMDFPSRMRSSAGTVHSSSDRRQMFTFEPPITRPQQGLSTIPLSKSHFSLNTPSTDTQHNHSSKPGSTPFQFPTPTFTYQHKSPLPSLNRASHTTSPIRHRLPQPHYGSSSSPSIRQRLDISGNGRSLASREQMPPPSKRVVSSPLRMGSLPVFATPVDRSGIAPGISSVSRVPLHGQASVRTPGSPGRRVARR